MYSQNHGCQKVLIIGLDGCRPDALREAFTPHLDELIRVAAFSERGQAGTITDSGPGWASILTGVWHDKHGVRTNAFDGANLERYPHFFCRLKEIRPTAYAVSIVHWGPIAKHL